MKKIALFGILCMFVFSTLANAPFSVAAGRHENLDNKLNCKRLNGNLATYFLTTPPFISNPDNPPIPVYVTICGQSWIAFRTKGGTYYCKLVEFYYDPNQIILSGCIPIKYFKHHVKTNK